MASFAQLKRITEALVAEVEALSFAEPVHTVYNPLLYARRPHLEYLKRFGRGRKRVLMLGMNPGPWGMSQTGVPFGEIAAVRDWMGIEARVDHPDDEHPKRPVTGFDCPRSEVSGRRLWGYFQSLYPDPADFFSDHMVLNYCPLVFMEESARNRTPDKLPKAERDPLEAACDRALRAFVEAWKPAWILGVGAFAEKRARGVFAEREDLNIASIPHPSPASPAANRGWAALAEKKLRELGLV
jgi:single-strand selective monofunctional uracil DNA glycosylase